MSDEGEPEFDLVELYEKHPSEINAIGISILSTTFILPLFDFMWLEGTRCGVWGDDNSCMGSVWLTATYIAILSTSLAPAIWGAFSLFAKYFTRVNKQRRDEVVWLATLGIPFSMIWATIWLYCFPHLWMLLPWGPWDTNWWKIFPFIFGLSWFGAGPLFAIIAEISGKFKEFAEGEKQAQQFEEDFKEKLSDSTNEGNKFAAQKLKPLDTSQPSAKENDGETKVIQTQFSSILGDMNIHEKYKK